MIKSHLGHNSSLTLLTTVTLLQQECFNISLNTKEEYTNETNAAWP